MTKQRLSGNKYYYDQQKIIGGWTGDLRWLKGVEGF